MTLLGKSYSVIEELMMGNAFSGFMGEILVKQISVRSKTLVRNSKIGGHPDLLPRAKYPGDSVLYGDEGIEVKVSKQRGGWQGHNAEEGWLMVFVYDIGNKMAQTEIASVLAAKLTKNDWSFSGRSATSRRTITASIKKEATERLRKNWIYRKGTNVSQEPFRSS
jgi:hypothetical protein